MNKLRKAILTVGACLVWCFVSGCLVSCNSATTQKNESYEHYVSRMSIKGNKNSHYLWFMMNLEPKYNEEAISGTKSSHHNHLKPKYQVAVGEPAIQALYAEYDHVTLKFIMDW